MLNPFKKNKYSLEEENKNIEPFDYRIKQIENIRKNRLIQLEKEKKNAIEKLNEIEKQLNKNRQLTIEKSLYYALLEPIIEKKFLFLDVNVSGLNRWVDDIKIMRQKINEIYSEHYQKIEDLINKNLEVEQFKKECQAMLIQIEKLALIENIWNENGGI